MFRHVLLPGVVLAVVLFSVSIGQAEEFNNPPEEAAVIPEGGWVTQFPYQRNVMIDFATNPTGWPADETDETNESRKDLVPGENYHMQGTDDELLYESDWIEWRGPVEWVDTSDTLPGDRQGMIGIVGQENGTEIGLTLHLDNRDRDWPRKHIWVEMELLMDPASVTAVTDVTASGDSQPVADADLAAELSDGWGRQNYWVAVEPNPVWEALNIDFEVTDDEAGNIPGTVLIDYVHVATECVPEPGTFCLFGLGSLLGLVVWWRRRKTC
ncbi:MAG: PEP-CTERM sorting domain-containing protein [Planctomycetota bacterium]